jgi:hypothetical protein
MLLTCRCLKEEREREKERKLNKLKKKEKGRRYGKKRKCSDVKEKCSKLR